MIEHITEPNLLKPTSPFSHAVVDEHYAYIAGRVAADIPGGAEIIGDTRTETELVMNSIRNTLKSLDLEMNTVVRVDVHLVDLHDIGEMDSAYSSFFEQGAYPARTCTQSGQLFGGSRVEITCIARR